MTTDGATTRVLTVRHLFADGWRSYLAVIVGNAAVQAATTAPFATPAMAGGFIALAVTSLLALVVAVVLAFAQAAASAAGHRWRTPGLRLWIAGAAAILVVGASAVMLAPLLILTTTAALIMLPAIAGRAGVFAGFRVFGQATLRAIVLTILTILLILLLWLAALLSGFFITRALSAALTWLVVGSAGVLLVTAWTALSRRSAVATGD